LHDIDKSGWWILITLVPIIGSIWFLVLLCTKGLVHKRWGQTVIVNQSNGVGTAGCVFAWLALFLNGVPGLAFWVWILGLILSFVGLFKSPRGLAVTGLVISLIDLILLLKALGALAAILSALF
jgi:uncharacterized membrane protein YhaH (DUF805 family)